MSKIKFIVKKINYKLPVSNIPYHKYHLLGHGKSIDCSTETSKNLEIACKHLNASDDKTQKLIINRQYGIYELDHIFDREDKVEKIKFTVRLDATIICPGTQANKIYVLCAGDIRLEVSNDVDKLEMFADAYNNFNPEIQRIILMEKHAIYGFDGINAIKGIIKEPVELKCPFVGRRAKLHELCSKFKLNCTTNEGNAFVTIHIVDKDKTDVVVAIEPISRKEENYQLAIDCIELFVRYWLV